MIGWIRTWLLGITGAAMIAALAASLTPEGAVKRAGRMAGSLLIFLAVVRPLMTIDPGELARAVEEYAALGGTIEEYTARSREEMKSIIAGQAGAYILDKATAAGIPLESVTVVVTQGEEEYPVPWSVTVTGDLSGEQRRQLSELIRQSFAIPEERQAYQTAQKEGSDD